MSARVTLLGTVGRDPELKVSQGGNSYAKFSVATRSGKKDKDGNWMADYWWECIGFGPIVDQISAIVRRGSYLEVDGKFGFEEYQKKDGTRGQKFTCTVERIAEKEKPASKVPSSQQSPEVNPFMQDLGKNINYDAIPF
jgi:single-strand DNA-binding protein